MKTAKINITRYINDKVYIYLYIGGVYTDSRIYDIALVDPYIPLPIVHSMESVDTGKHSDIVCTYTIEITHTDATYFGVKKFEELTKHKIHQVLNFMMLCEPTLNYPIF